MLMVTIILLYPDTPSSNDLIFSGARISIVKIILASFSVPVVIYIILNSGRLHFQYLDAALFAFSSFFIVRGILAAQTFNETGRIIVYFGLAAVIYYGMSILCQKRAFLRFVFFFLGVIGVIISIYALLEFSLRHNMLYEGLDLAKKNADFYRSGSTFAHPVILGLFLVQVAPFLVFLFSQENRYRMRIFYLNTIVILTLALGVTFSKSAWATAIVCIVVLSIWVVWKKTNSRKLLLILFIAIAVTFSFFSISLSGTVSSALFSAQRNAESYSLRKYVWSIAPAAFIQKPLTGFGMWQGAHALTVMEPSEKGNNALQGKYPIDNLYLTTLVEEGLIGSALLAASLFLIFYNGIRTFMLGMRYHSWCIPLLVSLFAVLFEGLFFDSLMVRQNMIIFWLSAGILRSLELSVNETEAAFIAR